jgi:hypothetical protein
MSNRKINEKLMQTIQSWDPLNLGLNHYETEAVDIIQAIHENKNVEQLSIKIQEIFNFSFELIIPIDECHKLAEELINIMNNNASSCEI